MSFQNESRAPRARSEHPDQYIVEEPKKDRACESVCFATSVKKLKERQKARAAGLIALLIERQEGF